jgi:hypothetical protein
MGIPVHKSNSLHGQFCAGRFTGQDSAQGTGNLIMKKALLFAGILALAISAQSKEKSYEKGVLLQMESTPCGSTEKGSKTVVGEILGTDGEHKSTEQLLCQEYTLRADRVIYRIRPRDEKHPALLPIGETAEFRIDKDKLVLRVPEANDKEHEYSVVSVTPRTDVQDPRAQKTAAVQPAP